VGGKPGNRKGDILRTNIIREFPISLIAKNYPKPRWGRGGKRKLARELGLDFKRGLLELGEEKDTLSPKGR